MQLTRRIGWEEVVWWSSEVLRGQQSIQFTEFKNLDEIKSQNPEDISQYSEYECQF